MFPIFKDIPMQIHETLELAALLSRSADFLLEGDWRERGLAIYWTAAKRRLDGWREQLRQVEPDLFPPSHRWLAEEIFETEVLTRTWTALACARDRRRGERWAEPVVRNAFLGHLDVRHSAMKWLIDPAAPVDASLLNRRRHVADGWSDVLVGRMGRLCDVSEFAVNPLRAKEFAVEEVSGDDPSAWRILRASLTARTVLGSARRAASSQTAAVAAGILACLPADAFDGCESFRSLCSIRLAAGGEIASQWLDELASLEGVIHC